MNARSRRLLWVVLHFFCPLVFFTNLTRNPYITQIVALNLAVLALGALWAAEESGRPEGWRVPRTAAWAPLGLFLALWAASWAWSYARFPEFLRPSMAAEGGRNALFLLVNAVLVFVLAAAHAASEEKGDDAVALAPWVVFMTVWGLLWTAYPSLRARPSGRPEDLWAQVWDPYGAFVWAVGLAGAAWLTRRGRVVDYLHLAFGVGFLSSVYGVLQYFNFEVVWPQVLNPYGGRAVSTFGNPNFLSSYIVVLMPVALGLFILERVPSRRAVYGALFVALHSALLATLTRSSWLGAAVACAALFASKRVRDRLREDPKPVGLVFGVALALALAWPSSTVKGGYAPGVIGRITEMKVLADSETVRYSPLHQRFLIWTCAWLMGSDTPLLGKGGGLFELFYPFYQGHLLHLDPFWQQLRTHANNSHNELLETYAQTGVLGLGAFLWLWASFFACAWKWSRERRGDDVVWLGLAAGVAGVLADNLLNVSLHFAVPAFLFWWAAGTALGRGAGAAAWEWQAPPLARRAAALGVVALALGAGWVWVRLWNREARYFSGFKLIRHANLPGAIKELERSRAWGPREVNALYELGNAYARSGRPADAADAYRDALSANAGYDEIYFNLATVLNGQLKRPEEAGLFYRTAWGLNPLSQEIYNGLTAYYLADPPRWKAEARELLETAVRVFPNNPNHWNNLGYLLTLEKDWPGAETAYARALNLSPDLALAERNLGALAAQSGRPRHPLLDGLPRLRELEAAVGRRDWGDRTLALARELARRYPDMPKTRFIHGTLLLTRGRHAESAAELEAVAGLDALGAAPRVNLAGAYLGLGRREEAVAMLRAALAVDPANPQARAQLQALGVSP
ncbi:MAG: tetratricopeptide repeat protein [Elusimicrobiota bacterium]|nr:tetratricopeptide repeat protein [Elusimicrobiota bacterium]